MSQAESEKRELTLIEALNVVPTPGDLLASASHSARTDDEKTKTVLWVHSLPLPVMIAWLTHNQTSPWNPPLERIQGYILNIGLAFAESLLFPNEIAADVLRERCSTPEYRKNTLGIVDIEIKSKAPILTNSERGDSVIHVNPQSGSAFPIFCRCEEERERIEQLAEQRDLSVTAVVILTLACGLCRPDKMMPDHLTYWASTWMEEFMHSVAVRMGSCGV